jgi:hypothetical protein
MLLLRSMLGSVLFLLALPGAAESLPELLKPVDPAVQARLMAKTNFDFRQQRYTAKRFRIVDIDWALLNQEGARFTITPFEDPELAKFAVTVKTKTTARQFQGPMREWVGEIENSGKLEYRPNGEMVQVPDYVIAMWIGSGPQEVTIKAARQVAAETGDAIVFGTLPEPSEAPDAPRVFTKLDLRTVSARWFAAPGVEMQLMPITDDPRYHFVYWLDRDKVSFGSHGGADHERKAQAAQEFVEQLNKERREAASKKPN